MKVLFLLDVAEPADPNEPVTPESLREDNRPAEADVLAALQRLGHEIETLVIFNDVSAIVEKLKTFQPEVVFNQTESFRDDRAQEANLVGLLELMKVRYIGAGPEGLMLCRDKALSKKLLSYHHIRVPNFVASQRKRPVRALKRFKYPAFVKPSGEDSSEGIAKASYVRDEKEALERVRFLHQKFECDVLVEEYIDGRELYLSVLGNERLTVFPPREIFFAQIAEGEPKFTTSHAKWNESYRERWGIRNGPAEPLPDQLRQSLDRLARTVYRVLKIRGFGRLDVRLTPAGEVFVIEANPNPGLAADDDFAQSAAQVGMTYDALIQEIVNAC
jgi:D-alanine-D-alanine ligase